MGKGPRGCEATRYYMNFTLKISHRNVQYQGVKRALTGLFVIDNNCFDKQFNHLKSITYRCKTRLYVTRVFLMLLSNG